jgi:hypothetical protein
MLETMGLRPRTLGRTDYPSKAPLDEVLALLDECAGAVILGYPQIVVTSGVLKGKPVSNELLLPTEWNHIEAGLAYARQLPLLVIHHVGIVRGIFDRGAISSYLYERDLQPPEWSLADEVQGAVRHWKESCLRHQVKGKASAPVAKPGKPVCPNCSTEERPIYMRRVSRDFQSILGATWECGACEYRE